MPLFCSRTLAAALFVCGCAGSRNMGANPALPDASSGVAGSVAGSTGSTGSAGSSPSTSMPPEGTAPGGTAGAAGGPSAPDAQATPTTTHDAGAAAGDVAPSQPTGPAGSFNCTRIIGINATSEWYTQGFETMVDNAKWEIVRVHSGFVELWADPNNAVWNTGPSSACTTGKPDRIIFVALNFMSNTLDQWLPPLTAVVKNLQAKFPGLKRIELATFVRAPMDQPCPQGPPYRSTITKAEDDAIAMVAAANPGLVTVSPKFEAHTCSEFSGNPPHPSAAGGAAWAKMIAAYYNGQGQ